VSETISRSALMAARIPGGVTNSATNRKLPKWACFLRTFVAVVLGSADAVELLVRTIQWQS
jgi:hypothetical protein